MPAGKQKWQNNLVLEVTTKSNTSCPKSRFGTVGPFVSALLPLMTPIKCTIKKPFLVAGEASFTQVRTFYASQVAAFIPTLNSRHVAPQPDMENKENICPKIFHCLCGHNDHDSYHTHQEQTKVTLSGPTWLQHITHAWQSSYLMSKDSGRVFWILLWNHQIIHFPFIHKCLFD